MEQGLPFHPALLIPLFVIPFAGLWLAITAFLGLMSGWFRLQRTFPDRREEPVLRLRFQSAAFGSGLMPANFGNCLTFDVCPGGLRVVVIRLLGPFSQPFFVPWAQIAAERRRALFGELVELRLGSPPAGTMLIRRATAERLAASGFLRLAS